MIAETEPLAVWSPGAGELLDPSALGQHPLEQALVGPERLVLDIDPGPPHAAGGRG